MTERSLLSSGVFSGAQSRPHVVSFYSYKGGVGRTLLAANVAASLARRGKTLIWDLDVEAPGMQFIPALRSPSKPGHGFLEWFQDWQAKHLPTSSQPRSGQLPQTTPTELKRFLSAIQETSIHQLDCLAALGEEIDPAPVYQRIDWGWLQREPEQAIGLFDILFGYLHAVGYRYVVIDSRTGYTDLGALLIGLVPDVTVLVGGYGEQNLKGLVRIWRALKKERPELSVLRSGRRAPRLEIVASPIPEHDTDLAVEGRRKWARAFDLDMHGAFEIPYDPELPFSEKLLVVAEPDRRVAKRYEAVASALAEHFDNQEAELNAAARAFAHRPDLFNFDDIAHQRAAGSTFESMVAQVLRLLGYRIEHVTQGHQYQADLEAHIRIGLDEFKYLVECKGGNKSTTSSAAVRQMMGALAAYRSAGRDFRGMVVSNTGFTAEAIELAKNEDVRLFSMEELEYQLLNFQRHLDRVIRDFEHSSAAESYMVQGATLHSAGPDTKRIEDLITMGISWSRGGRAPLWLVLGSAGSGKSTFVWRLTYELAVLAKRDPMAPVPLRVGLGALSSNIESLEQMLADQWQQYTDERKDPQLFRHLLNQGRIVALLDGLDETMPGAVVDDRTDLFRRLAGVTVEPARTLQGNRVLMTSRDDLFAEPRFVSADAADNDRIASGRLRTLAQAFKGDITTLEPLGQEQIFDFLTHRLGFKQGRSVANVLKKTQLAGIVDKPFLLELLVTNMKEAATQRVDASDLNLETLFLMQIARWRAKAPEQTQGLHSEALKDIVQLVASEMWSKSASLIQLGDLYELLINKKAMPADADVARLDALIQSSPFLFRESDGVYRFNHRSVHEFFVAWHIADCLHVPMAGAQLDERLDVPRLTPGVVQALLLLLPQHSPSVNVLKAALIRLLSIADGIALSPNAARVNGLVMGLAFAVRDADAKRGLEDVRRMCQFYIPDGAKLENTLLKGLDLNGVRLRGASLSGADMDEVDLVGADLAGAVMKRTSLRGARLIDTSLASANLVRVDASRSTFERVDLIGANASESRWVGAVLSRLRMDGANFRDADLRDALFADETLQREIELRVGA